MLTRQISNLDDLRRVPRLVSADEHDPLIQVDRAEDGVRMDYFTDRETVAIADRVAERPSRDLEGSPRLVSAKVALRQRPLSRSDSASAVEHSVHVDGADDGRLI